MAKPTLIYKIAILELLNKSDFPLSNSQISNFFLEKGYTDYFSTQQAISDDEEAGLIESTLHHNNTTYALTEEGANTLELFRNKLNSSIVNDISRYMCENGIQMKEENSYLATYTEAPNGGYTIQCKISDGDVSTLDLSLHVGSKAMAETICNNWKVRSDDVYAALMDILVQ